MQLGRDTGSDAHGGHGLILYHWRLASQFTVSRPRSTSTTTWTYSFISELIHPTQKTISHHIDAPQPFPSCSNQRVILGIVLEPLYFALPGCGLPWLRLVAGVFVLCVAQLIRHLVHETLLCNSAL